MATQSRDDFEAHLKEQLDFLEASASSYDSGFDGEAKRLATAVRVLLHDTPQSTSLLTHLGRKNIDFHDSSLPFEEGNIATHAGLTITAEGKTGPTYLPYLDSHTITVPRWVPFDDWWDTVIFVDDQGKTLTRKQLALALANQDGGAHVDSKLTDTYARLTRNGSVGWRPADAKSAQHKFSPPHYASMRQIAHEALKTLRADYTRSHPMAGATKHMSGIQIFTSPPPPARPAPGVTVVTRPLTQVPRVGRNDPCPCGSGKKYKKCHGFYS